MLRTACVALAWAGLAGSAGAVDRLDPRDFDTRVAPCTDFYRFANGGWLDRSPVPPGAERINRFSELDAGAQAQQVALLRRIATQPGSDPLDAPLSLLIRSIQDEAALAGARAQALDALLAALPQATHGEQVAALLAGLQSRGLPVLFRIESAADRQLVLRADPLTLPDPAFYLDPRSEARDWLARYRGYVETLLGLAGSTDPATDSAWVLDFDAKLAQALQAAGTPAAQALPARKLAREYRALPWKAVIQGLKLGRVDRFVLQDPAAFAALDRLLGEAHPVQWRAWLRFRVAHLLAPYLDAPFRDAHARFIRTALAGSPPPADADVRALQLTRELLGDAFAQRYLDAHLDAGGRAALASLTGSLRDALTAAIAANPRWREDTRRTAQAKLDALTIALVEPAQRPDLSALQLNPANLVGNVLAIQRWRVAALAAHATAALPADPLRAQLGYQREHNRLLLTPALLQAPLFDPGADAALQYAGLGSLLAHELAHGFDLGGAGFDGDGRAAPWWDEADRAAWQQAMQPLVAQYAGYALPGGQHPDGERSLAENAADLAGLQLAWNAFAAHHDIALPQRDGLTPAQRFFVGWASLWRENALEAVRLRDAAGNEQAPPALRAIGPLPHLPAFADAFACAAGSPMLRAPAAVRAWP